jgi:DNA-binding transcriptional regulator YiaG
VPNVNAVLREEILRLSRKEVREAVTSLRKSNTSLRHDVAELKRRCGELAKEQRRLGRLCAAAAPAEEEADETTLERMRPTSAMIRRERERLGLSQREMAELIGVSTNSVNLWEHKDGRLALRAKAREGLLRLRGMGKREAAAALEEG